MNNKIKFIAISLLLLLVFDACKLPQINSRKESRYTPDKFAFSNSTDSAVLLNWKQYFTDKHLQTLIDSALSNNQELNIIMQEIAISKNEIQARKGEYLPFVSGAASGGVDKTPRYTTRGASEANINIKPGTKTPDPLPDIRFAAVASWEVDIWHKLRNAKKSAALRYLATTEGRNFMVTNLVAEIANSYYELLSLDYKLRNINQNIAIQSNALEIVKMEKDAARVTELAVRKFEAEVLKTTSMQYDIKQQIVETENRINFLVGRFPQSVQRDTQSFYQIMPTQIQYGLPSQLLQNRTDIRSAEYELSAAKLDIKVAKARFYPSLNLSAAVGLQAFNPAYLATMPESLLLNAAGDLVAPLINRNAISAAYKNANAKQIQAAYNYERTILNAYVEVVNQVAKLDNVQKSYDLRSQQVQALTNSIEIANNLFKSARADYMEVLLTQRDALESRFDLIDTKMEQLRASVNLYRALGGGWK